MCSHLEVILLQKWQKREKPYKNKKLQTINESRSDYWLMLCNHCQSTIIRCIDDYYITDTKRTLSNNGYDGEYLIYRKR